MSGLPTPLPYILTKPKLIIIPYNLPPYKLHVLLLLLISERVCPNFFPQKEPFNWPLTNIFGTWGTPQHRSLNMFLS
jgi:hypothetical protein